MRVSSDVNRSASVRTRIVVAARTNLANLLMRRTKLQRQKGAVSLLDVPTRDTANRGERFVDDLR
jgi:hypothetical protein